MSVPVTITITGIIADNSRVEHLRTELKLHDLMPEVLKGVADAGIKDAASTVVIGQVEPIKKARKPRAPKVVPVPVAAAA